jgi:hypothetical protein
VAQFQEIKDTAADDDRGGKVDRQKITFFVRDVIEQGSGPGNQDAGNQSQQQPAPGFFQDDNPGDKKKPEDGELLKENFRQVAELGGNITLPPAKSR